MKAYILLIYLLTLPAWAISNNDWETLIGGYIGSDPDGNHCAFKIHDERSVFKRVFYIANSTLNELGEIESFPVFNEEFIDSEQSFSYLYRTKSRPNYAKVKVVHDREDDSFIDAFNEKLQGVALDTSPFYDSVSLLFLNGKLNKAIFTHLTGNMQVSESKICSNLVRVDLDESNNIPLHKLMSIKKKLYINHHRQQVQLEVFRQRVKEKRNDIISKLHNKEVVVKYKKNQNRNRFYKIIYNKTEDQLYFENSYGGQRFPVKLKSHLSDDISFTLRGHLYDGNSSLTNFITSEELVVTNLQELRDGSPLKGSIVINGQYKRPVFLSLKEFDDIGELLAGKTIHFFRKNPGESDLFALLDHISFRKIGGKLMIVDSKYDYASGDTDLEIFQKHDNLILKITKRNHGRAVYLTTIVIEDCTFLEKGGFENIKISGSFLIENLSPGPHSDKESLVQEYVLNNIELD